MSIDLLIFAMVAAFIALRLRSVLGKRTGNERQRPSPVNRDQSGDNVVNMPNRAPSMPETDKGIANLSDPGLKKTLTEIRLAEPQFDLEGFLQGASIAFEMIVESFAKGDKQALEPLLAPDVYQGFANAIDERAAAGEVLDTQLVRIKNVEVADASLEDRDARVTVRFTSEQINVTRDASGEIVDGDASRTEEVIDLWTFARKVKSSDPNWQLAETRTPEA